MKRLEVTDLKNIGLLKHYRIIRKWACKNNNLNDADLELLIYLECMEYFSKQDFKDGAYSYSWDNRRWNRLLKEDWITVWRQRNRTTQKYTIYTVSTKAKHLISRIYRILLGEEDIPMTESNVFYKNESYTDKVMNKAIDDMIKDPKR